jgi:hypothetical protein
LNKILRSGVVAAGLAMSTVMGMTSAHAATAAVFTGEAIVASFGTGASNGTATLCVNGTIGSATATCTSGSNGAATFSLVEATATCPATGSAQGEVHSTSGPAWNTNFTWTRVGAVAVISTSGGTVGAANGAAVFAVPGNPCGTTNVHVTFAGFLAG